jgi:hypothetical protein
VKLNLVSDHGGRSMERALVRAYRLGYEDATKLRKRGAKMRPLRTGETLAKEICSRCYPEQIPFLRSAYGAGLMQGFL